MAKKSKLNAGIIGLGIIGSRIATNLRNAGIQVYVWNRSPKPAPNFLASPAEVAGLCDVLQLVVADSTALFAILDALRGSLSARHTVICSATVGDRVTQEAARMVEATGAKFLDAPFTGSKEAAEKGQLVYYIGGSDEAFRNAEPILKASSKAIVRIGGVGQAATVKIVTNMLAATAVQTLAEACAILRRSGIDPSLLGKALENHGVRSGVLDMKLPKMVSGEYETHFSVKHMFKDVQIAIQAANQFDMDIPATTAAAGALYSAIHQGWADMDFSAVAKFYEQSQTPAAEPEEEMVEEQIPMEEPPPPVHDAPALNSEIMENSDPGLPPEKPEPSAQ